MKRKLSVPVLIGAFILGVVISGSLVAYFFVQKIGGYELLPRVIKYSEALSVIESEYVGDTDVSALDTAVFDSIVDFLGDKWSYYMTANEYDVYQEYSHNQYTGIGVNITKDEESGNLLVVSVTEGSPAQKAGILAGHILKAVDGMDISGMQIFEIRQLILDKSGQDITLTVQAGDNLNDIVVKSEILYLNPVSYELIDDKTGYISISNFEEGCAEEVISSIDELSGSGAKNFIFDVRGNPGGRLSELLELLDFLLPEGELFISRDKDGVEQIETSDAEYFQAPMAVLIDGNSYSAAEFFAAALSEYDWAVIVGERSTGKARSQQTFVFDDGSALHISTAVYLTPNRVDLSAAGGLVPDIEVILSADSDNQLQAAVDHLIGDNVSMGIGQ